MRKGRKCTLILHSVGQSMMLMIVNNNNSKSNSNNNLYFRSTYIFTVRLAGWPTGLRKHQRVGIALKGPAQDKQRTWKKNTAFFKKTPFFHSSFTWSDVRRNNATSKEQ